MIKCGTSIHFQEPSSDIRLLRRAEVVEVDVDSFTVQFRGEGVPLCVGDELTVYFEDGDEFMQQLVSIAEIEGGDAGLITLHSIGDAISAESRCHYRVSTISADVHASIAEEGRCAVQDISHSGLGVVASGKYALGTVVAVVVEHGGDIYSGMASVKSRLELRPGHVRYGLHVLDDDGDLLGGLRLIDAATQQPHATKPF